MFNIWNGKGYKDFESAAFVLTGCPDESKKKIISQLNEILQPTGSSIALDSLENDDNTTSYYLCIRVSPTAAADYSRRGAGRKPKQTKELIPVKEVRKMLEQRSADSVAAQLGISRSTLFRRLKELDDDDFF